MSRARLYGLGAAIGFTPREVDVMTLWELAACIDGYNEAHGGESEPPPPTADEFEQMKARHYVLIADKLKVLH